jgi:hypothetical protein
MKLPSADGGDQGWRFISNHVHVLACISRDPEVTIRELALRVGVTERSAATIIGDLERGGYLTRARRGRRNHYTLDPAVPLRHPLHRHRTIGDLLAFLNEGADA